MSSNLRKIAKWMAHGPKSSYYLDDEQAISAFDFKVKTTYQTVLNRMIGFVNNSLDTSETVHKDVNLVRAIVDLIQQDQTIKAGDG